MTAQSQILSPQSRGAEYILSYIVSRTVTRAVAFIHVCQMFPFRWQ